MIDPLYRFFWGEHTKKWWVVRRMTVISLYNSCPTVTRLNLLVFGVDCESESWLRETRTAAAAG